jgi:hypothetical protein
MNLRQNSHIGVIITGFIYAVSGNFSNSFGFETNVVAFFKRFSRFSCMVVLVVCHPARVALRAMNAMCWFSGMR